MSEQNSSMPSLPSRRFRSTEPVPAVVEAAFWILVAGAVLAAILSVVDVSARATLPGSTPSLNPALPGSGLPLGVTVIEGLVGALIRIGISVMLRRGYSPARGYLTAVSALALLVTVLHGVDLVNILLFAALVVPVVLVWLPASNEYFRAVTQARKLAVAAGAKIGFLG